MSTSPDQNDATVIDPSTLKSRRPVENIESEWGTSQQEGIQVGSVLKSRFIIKERLGSGGMGTVFRATDIRREEARDQQSDVAIKVLNDEFREDPELFIALQRETKKTQLLAHPNIVTVYDFDKDGANVFMIMELLEGRTLSEFIKDECAKGMLFKNAWHIIKDLTLALAYAHKKNIIHSDFKPGNIFITYEGDVKVLDFGIACAVVMSDAQHNDTVFNARDLGALTPTYASLEMLQGKPPDPSDDVYALACVSYEILSGKHPFGRLSAEKALDIGLALPSIKGLDRRRRLALSHALAFKRGQRTATANEFFEAIKPKSVWPKVLSGVAIITFLLIVSGVYYTFDQFSFMDDELIELSVEQKLKVDDFLELGHIHFDVGYLTAPSGSNALWAYKQVLGVDPYNQKAQQGLKKIADLIERQAVDLFVAGHYQASLSEIEEGLGAVPKHGELLALKSRILSMEIGTQ